MKHRRIFVFAAWTALIGAAGQTAIASQATVTDDSYSNQARPTTTAGTLPQVLVDSADHAFFKFDLSQLPAGITASQVSKATLTLWVYRVTTTGTFDVAQVTGAWDENSLTWNAEPATSAPLAIPVAIATANSFVRVDVTSIVQNWLNGSANQGIRLTANAATPSASVFFDSKESTSTSHAAYIDIVLSGPAGATGPQGPQGPTGATGPQGPAGPNVLAVGSASAPSLSFQGDSLTGIYHSATGSVDITSQGSRAFGILGNGDIDMVGGLRKNGIPFLSTTANTNLAVGPSALFSNAGTNNTAVGVNSLKANTSGCCNTAVGFETLLTNQTGNQNTAVGHHALANATGSSNTAIGFLSLYGLTTGTNNIGLGGNALSSLDVGVQNIAIGDSAGQSLTGSSNGNIFIGLGAGYNVVTSSNNIEIGTVGTAADFHTIRLGDTGVQSSTFIAGIRGKTTGQADAVPVVIDSKGQLGTISSSRRFKEQIQDMGTASDGLMRLRPVTYRYKEAYADGSMPIQYGLIAEEVAEVYPELVAHDQDGQIETVQYYKLDAMLLNEVQKQRRTMDEQQRTIEQQQRLIESLASRLSALETQVSGQK